MDNKKTIGSRINAALARNNCMQKELAAHLGVPDNTISYFCSGKRTPNTEQIIEIAKFLNVSADFLLGLSEVQSYEVDLQAAVKYTGLSEAAIDDIKERDMAEALNYLITNGSFGYLLYSINKFKEEINGKNV